MAKPTLVVTAATALLFAGTAGAAVVEDLSGTSQAAAATPRPQATSLFAEDSGGSPADPQAQQQAHQQRQQAGEQARQSASGQASGQESSSSSQESGQAAEQSQNDGEAQGEQTPTGQGGNCEASNYWEEQPTASGEQFDPSAMTAAHKTLPFDTMVEVTNPANGESVVVRINDRGPYVQGRCLDLSRAAFTEIASPNQGVIPVRWQVVE